MFHKADANNNGVISYDEFVLASMDHEKLHNEKKLKAAFQMFDKNNDGSISPDEILSLFQDNSVFNI